MRLSRSAHLDTFCRDRLPPPDQWPEFRFDLPELSYPERLNCAAELLDATAARVGASRPCLHSVTGTGRRNLDLRRGGPPHQPAGPGADRGLRPAPGQPGPAPRPEHPLARRRLARRDQGRRGGGDHDGPAAAQGDRHHRRPDPAEPGPVRPPLRRGPARRRAGATTLHYGGAGPLAARCAAKDGRFTAVDTAADDVAMLAFDLGHHRPAEGGHALPPGRAGHRRHLCQAPDQAARRTTFSPALPRSASPSASAACCCSRSVRARRRCSSSAPPRPSWPTPIAAHGVTVLSTAPTALPGHAGRGEGFALKNLRRASRPRAPAEVGLGGVPPGHRDRDHRRHRLDRDAARLHRRRRR